MSTTARLSIAEYERMIACGAFDNDRRLEFIRGEIREMSPINPPHEDAIDYLNRWSIENLSRRQVRVRVQNTVGLPELESIPQPDLAWVRPGNYRHRRPTPDDVLLVIEVSDSSLRYDTGEKADLYAEAGIRDYWVVNIPEQVVEVRRDPVGGRYRSLQTFSGDQPVRPLAFPNVTLLPSALWAEEDGS
jgi:Uma2 family endonuclease